MVDVVAVLQQHRADRVIVEFLLADGEVPGDEHVALRQGRQASPAEVLLEEVRPVVGHRVLLVQGRPEPRTDGALDLVQRLDVVALRVQGLALVAQEPAVLRRGVDGDQVGVVVEVLVVLGDGGVLDDDKLVCVGVCSHRVLESACQVVVMPPSLNHKYAPSRGKSGVGGRAIPIPQLFADVCTVGLLSILQRVINDQQVGTLARDTAAHTGSHVGAPAALQAPLLGTLVIWIQTDVKHRVELGVSQHLLDLLRESHGQRHVVRAGDDLVVRVAAQVPGRERP